MASKDSLHARNAKERKLRQHKELLVESVRIYILPVLINAGFIVGPRAHRVSDDPKTSGIFPFGLLRRMRHDGGVDLVEIQFMTYQRAAFRINACAVPKEGMMTLGGHRSAEELDAGGLHDHFEMYASPRWRRWFSLHFWRLRAPAQSNYDKLALQVAGYLTEVDRALREGRLGPHMRKVIIPLPQGQIK